MSFKEKKFLQCSKMNKLRIPKYMMLFFFSPTLALRTKFQYTRDSFPLPTLTQCLCHNLESSNLKMMQRKQDIPLVPVSIDTCTPITPSSKNGNLSYNPRTINRNVMIHIILVLSSFKIWNTPWVCCTRLFIASNQVQNWDFSVRERWILHVVRLFAVPQDSCYVGNAVVWKSTFWECELLHKNSMLSGLSFFHVLFLDE